MIVFSLDRSKALLLFGGLALPPQSASDDSSPDSFVASSSTKLATYVSGSFSYKLGRPKSSA